VKVEKLDAPTRYGPGPQPPKTPDLPPPRETAWVVKLREGRWAARDTNMDPYTTDIITNSAVRRFSRRCEAETLCHGLGVGHPVLVYTDTMEEVPQ
jgi:hypothetical protein